MKKRSLILAAVFLSAFQFFSLSALLPAAESGGLELGLQAYTFRQVTLAETLDRAVAMKIKNIQAYGGQKVSAKVDEKFGHNMSDAAKAEVRALFKARGLNLTSYGVVTPKTEADWRQVFAFAKEMGLRDIATEPKAEWMPLIDKLSSETGVKVAIHNHPRPSIYFDPDFALATIKPYGKNIGLCADTGHWARSGFDPVATLRKVEGHIISLHFKDLTEVGKKADNVHDMPWGTGASEAAKQILELRRQGFKGIAYMEYEYKVPLAQLDVETAECADWFHRAVAAKDADLIAGCVLPYGYVAEKDISKEWSGKRGGKAEQWAAAKPLFAADLSNAEFKPGAWAFENDVLVCKGSGNIWTKATYGDFSLNLDFRCEEKTDSGIILRCGDIAGWVQNSIEVQIIQDERPNDKHNTGGIYDVSAPGRLLEIEPGKWYHATVTAIGSKIQVVINSERLTNVDLAKWKTAGANPDGTKNKFKKAYAEMPKEGRLGLQSGKSISFRNIVIEEISDAAAQK